LPSSSQVTFLFPLSFSFPYVRSLDVFPSFLCLHDLRRRTSGHVNLVHDLLFLFGLVLFFSAFTVRWSLAMRVSSVNGDFCRWTFWSC
jgi:hypothetical protein